MSIVHMLARLDPRTAISGLVETAVKGLTGREELGRIAGLLTDLKTGNYLGAALRGGELLAGSLRDFQMEAEFRWGPGAPARICGCPATVAESCPPPRLAGQVTLDVGWQLGIIGWSFGVSVGAGDDPGEASTSSPAMRGIIDNPSLSLEAKVALLFAGLIDDLDDRIEGKLRSMESASRAQEADKAAGGDGESSSNDFNRISFEVQMLMQKRSQMYSLQSNMTSMFNDVSMKIINNVR